jgi:UDP-N-acetylmuramate--alanine ligase
MDDLRASFLEYINRVPFYGLAVLSADDENIARLIPKVTRRQVTFGFAEDAEYRATEFESNDGRTSFVVTHHGETLGQIKLQIPGRYNAANALAAVAAAYELEVPFETIATTLAEFRGVARRFEIVGEVNDVLVIDDYAHHPTEVQAVLSATRETYGRRIIAVFQPHLYSRTKDFVAGFAEALALADHCILTDIYPAREEPIEGVTSELILKAAAKNGATNFSYVGTKENALDEIARLVKPGDIVMTIGAGSITHIRQMILERLQAR